MWGREQNERQRTFDSTRIGADWSPAPRYGRRWNNSTYDNFFYISKTTVIIMDSPTRSTRTTSKRNTRTTIVSPA